MKKVFLIIICFLMLPFIAGAEEETVIEKVDLNLKENEIVVTFLDLSSGEAILVQTGKGETILINTGGPHTGEELLDRLEMFNVLKFDAVILTNVDREYAANVDWLQKSYMIERLVVPQVFKQQWINDFAVQHDNTEYWTINSVEKVLPHMVMRVVDMQATGGMSLYFSYGKHDFLLMGKADKAGEEALLKRAPLNAEILKVAEFAKEGGTSQDFLEKTDPHVAVIFHERKKMPSSAVLERLNETWIDIYETRQFGNVSFRCDAENYEVVTIESEENN
ncbi:hypothetical protein LC040_09315 [Bacillus tianshenii]|nr:hypothetical protein LC040_09315 [Bacillus tianshenii]